MIEISVSEIVLFAWASLATALYLKTKHEENMARKRFMLMLENDEAREEMIKQFRKATQGGAI